MRAASSLFPWPKARSRAVSFASRPWPPPFTARSPSSSRRTSCGTVALPGHLSATFSAPGSMTNSVGQPSTGNLSRKGAASARSVFMDSQTNRPACRLSAASVKTFARIERQLCHHGAQTSTNTGTPRAFAWAMAPA